MINFEALKNGGSYEGVSKAVMSDIRLRWILLSFFIPALVILYVLSGQVMFLNLLFLCVGAGLYNLGIYFLQKKEMIKSTAGIYLTTAADIAIVTGAILLTGGHKSPLFVLYLMIIIDGCFDMWPARVFAAFQAGVLAVFTLVYFLTLGSKPEFFFIFDFAGKFFLMLATGILANVIADTLRKEHARTNAVISEHEKISGEKEKLNEELSASNKMLSERVKAATENLERTNIMLVKKNISLLAAHEIYKTANDANSKSELLSMMLGVIVPLMKGNGGVILSVDRKAMMAKVESYKKISGFYDITEGSSYEITPDSELNDLVARRRSRLFENASESTDYFVKDCIKNGSCIAAPLSYGRETNGIMMIFNKNPGIYSKPDAELIELLAEQISTLLFSRVLFDQVKEKVKGLERLSEVSVNIEASLDEDEIIGTALVEGVKKMFKNSSGAIIMSDEDGRLKIRAQYGQRGGMLDRVVPINSIAGWVFTNNRPLYITDIRGIKFYNPDIDSLYLRQAAILSPISVKGKPMGVLAMTKMGETYSRDELSILNLLAGFVGGDIEAAKLYENVKRDYIHSIYALAAAVDAKDHYTHGHSTTVMKYATKIAEKMGLPSDEIENVKYGGLLHDIGKIAISENIINKPGKLSNEEYSIIKTHPQHGANIVSKIESMKKLVPLVLHHHEWINGSGYPLGLRGTEIPLGARIISVADAYSTITSKRPYRDERTNDFAIKEMNRCKGTQFDPEAVDALLVIIEEEEAEIKAAKEKTEQQEKKDKKRIRTKIEGEQPQSKDDFTH